MENTINNQFKNLILENLDLDFFFMIGITENEIHLIGWYSKKLEKYILKKSFKKQDSIFFYIFNKNNIQIELKNK